MAPSVLLLLGLLSLAGSLSPPRTSFLLNSADRPLVLFSLPDVHNTTTLLLSDDGSTLYVGARDAVLSLDVSQSDVIKLKNKVEWSPSEAEITECQNKGKDAVVDCPNFVRVLQPINSTHLYACGSYAYSPHDAFIDTESFSMVPNVEFKARYRCPFSPVQTNTAITVDGELFTATTTDFRGVKPQISRHFSRDGRYDVSQDTSVNLLEEPTFVGASADQTESKVYFFFSEVGNEFSFTDELQIARVAQVCKDDVGGLRTLQNKWTSFAKAPLLCQLPKQLPFNVLRDVFTLPPPDGSNASDTLFYGVFTSQWSSSPESAVCVFNLQDIRTVFAGSYRTFMETHQWSSMAERLPYLGQCGLDKSSDSDLAQVKKTFLTSGSVKPIGGGGPILVSSGQQYSHVSAMRTQGANGKQYTVLFLLTESGFLHKVVLLDGDVHVIEEIQVFTQPQLIKSIVLSSSKGALYVGTSEGVTAVPVARCSIYRTCSQCVLARDPLCGWSRAGAVCSSVDQDNMAQDVEDGNVEQQCQGQTGASLVTEVNVKFNEAVRLECLKPSNLATLTWTSPQLTRQPDKLFIQSADGSLSFLASDDTFGTYRCEAEEGGYKEVVASYDVRQVVSPRAISPFPKADEYHETKDETIDETKDETYEKVVPDEPVMYATQPSRVTKGNQMEDNADKSATILKDETVSSKDDSESKNEFDSKPLGSTPSSSRDGHSWDEQTDETRVKEKSYYSELVIVSLLLVICICVLMLGGLHIWRQRKTGVKSPLVSPDDCSKTIQSMESVPSLSSPEDAISDVKVVD